MKLVNGILIDTRAEWGPPSLGYHFEHLGDGSILSVSGNQVHRSVDQGQTWQSWALSVAGQASLDIQDAVLLRTAAGNLVMAGMDFGDYYFKWNNTTNLPDPSSRLDVWAMQSFDNGQTWTNAQRILDGYCGALNDILQTGTGQIVLPVQPMLYDKGRHATVPYVSTDNGGTWQTTQMLDVGGRGHHDGSIEATLVELGDGRIWTLMRTSLDQFWSAYSDDGGRTWPTFEASQIDASSSPGYLTRLQSGRLAMVWNRLYPEGQTDYARTNENYSSRPATWMRHELSIAFSEDDGQSWTPPVLLAKDPSGGRVSYPTLFEPSPGRLWVVTQQATQPGKVRLALNEADFVGSTDYVFQMPEVTARRASEQFAYRYEFDVDATKASLIDLDGNGKPDWAVGGTGTIQWTGQGTVLIDSAGQAMSYLESGISSADHLWPSVGFDTAEGFTIEWRMRVLRDGGSEAAFALVADPVNNDELPVLAVGQEDQRLGSGVCAYDLQKNDNANEFHTFRLVRDADSNSGLWWVWRDGRLLMPYGFPVTRQYVRDALYFGDVGTPYDGAVEVDYVRLTQGAFAPPAAEPIPGDANGDGFVDDLDASILAAHWQTLAGATWAQGDFNGDGSVNDLDASILAAHWLQGQPGGGPAVPEPQAIHYLVTLLVGGVGLALGGRSRGR